MKDYPHPPKQHFDQLVEQCQSSQAPRVDVCAAVRAQLEQEIAARGEWERSVETLTQWFSGIKAGLFLGASAMLMVIAGYLLIDQLPSQETVGGQSDEITEFIEQGDWSQFL